MNIMEKSNNLKGDDSPNIKSVPKINRGKNIGEAAVDIINKGAVKPIAKEKPAKKCQFAIYISEEMKAEAEEVCAELSTDFTRLSLNAFITMAMREKLDRYKRGEAC